jgi:glucose/arabinose dehydrogenase
MIFKPAFLLLATILLFPLASAWAEVPTNQLTEAERMSGWELLFDGTTTTGWRNYQKDAISDGWKVIDGALTRVGQAGDIVTEKQYKNFELAIEYKISKGGNSGVMFHVSEDQPTPWQTGPEIQVQDNVDGHDPQKAGWLYQLYQPVKPNWVVNAEKQAGIASPDVLDATRPAGEWNELYIRISKEQSQVVLNGMNYFTFTVGSQDWNAKVAASKFAKFPKFGKNESGHICLQDHGNEVAFRNIKIRELDENGSAKNPVNGEVAVRAVPAFPKLQWEGWQGLNETTGKEVPMRPLILTHAADGSNRIFVGTQEGRFYVFENDPACKQAKLFLDIQKQVSPWKDGNEEGMLGFALHPDYKNNGYFYVYYTSTQTPRKSLLSRFSVSKDDPNRADPASETVIMEILQPFSNHNGGSILFGKDGYLYIGLGDGGSANDPLANGQNLGTWLGSILRIDVNKQQDGKPYGIPEDNPFVKREGALPEIYAYGVRNVWRLSLDRETGTIWFADVGQDLWEEINILQAGGNYGWSMREASHAFGNRTADVADKPIDPVWEYDHRIGKSITGGLLYRGKSAPSLTGKYVYADYVSTEIWALDYDRAAGKVKQNLRVPIKTVPIMAFGEDEQGEGYFMGQTVTGTDIYKFAPVE